MSDRIVFVVNGQRHELSNPDPTTLLIDYLRAPEVGLTGTKLSCGEGGCGACTVMLSSYDPDTDTVRDRTINSCLHPVCALDGTMVTTTEGIGNVADGLDEVQYRIAQYNGSQCGFCTPGFVMEMFTLRRNRPQATQREIEDAFDGHICRCTGFRPILEACKSFAVSADSPSTYRENHPCIAADGQGASVAETPVQITFPDWLKVYVAGGGELEFSDRGYTWLRVSTVEEIQSILLASGGDRAQVKLVGGNTDIGIYKVDVNNPHVLVDITRVDELQGLTMEGDRLHIGATTPIQELIAWIDSNLSGLPEGQQTGLADLKHHLDEVACLQVRNIGTIGGNVMMTRLRAQTPTPFPSDVVLTFANLGATAILAVGEERVEVPVLDIPADLPPDAVLVAFHLPLSQPGDRVRSYKIRLRNQNSHAIVNAAFTVRFCSKGTVEHARVIMGGLSQMPHRYSDAEAALIGQPWTEATLSAALAAIADTSAALVAANPDFPGAQYLPPRYRETLTETLFYKFFLHISEEIAPGSVPPEKQSGGEEYVRPLSGGVEITDVYPDESPVGMPILKESAFIQASGEAQYTEDMPLPRHGLQGCFVFTKVAKGAFRYTGFGPADALKAAQAVFPGLRDYVTIDDVPGGNLIGMGGDDPVFADPDNILCYGQPVGLVLADDLWTARMAARYIADELIEFRAVPHLQTIEQAEAADSFFGQLETLPHITHIVRNGSDEAWLKEPGPVEGATFIQGSQRSSAQAQWYMETQNCMVLPGERDSYTVYSSTQHPAAVQQYAASVLGIHTMNVEVYVRRLGGGFGGKQFRPYMLSSAAIVAVAKTGRPVRLVLDRNEDMLTIGKRHPYRGDFSVAIRPDGMLEAMRLDFTSNAGSTFDASPPVIDLSQQNGDNSYFVPTFMTSGKLAKTNLASNTAMRSFGTVQASLVIEEAVEMAAHAIGMTPEDVREKNLYMTGSPQLGWQHTHYAQALKYCNVRFIYRHLREHCRFDERLEEVRRFNRENRWRKRGISLVPYKYGVGYQPRFMEQGAANVLIYSADGSVKVLHGGIEVGQGINTKMAQIAADTLGIPMDWITVGATTTSAAPNSQPTAASSGSDLFGSAVKMACETLKARLLDYCASSGTADWLSDASLWPGVISGAYMDRVDLQSEALYAEPYIDDVGGTTPYGRAFLYYTYSAACSEVEIDVLTGETTVLRTDILFDNGKSLNPCLDIGQIEGAFVQGMGLMLTEDMQYEADGNLYSSGTWEYKPPCTKTIPVQLNVRLHRTQKYHSYNGEPLDAASVNSSKGIGEPPLVLATSVFFAVKHAVVAARQDAGDSSWPTFRAPATVARVQSACKVSTADLNLNPS